MFVWGVKHVGCQHAGKMLPGLSLCLSFQSMIRGAHVQIIYFVSHILEMAVRAGARGAAAMAVMTKGSAL